MNEINTIGGEAQFTSANNKNKKFRPVLSQLALGKLADTLVANMRDYTPKEAKKPMQRALNKNEKTYFNIFNKKDAQVNSKEKKVIVTTFLNANNLTSSSKLGRLIAEGLIAELHKRNFTVIEFHARDAVSIKEMKGDFALSRDVKQIKKRYQANYLITGTYSDAGESIFIAGRLIDMETSAVTSASNYEVKKTDAIASLIEDDPITKATHDHPVPSAYER